MQKIFENIRGLINKGAAHIFVGSFLQKFVAFFGSIFVVRLLTKSEYGLLSYVENIYSYALIIAGFGLSNAMLRYVVIGNDEKKRPYYQYIVQHSIVRNIIIASVICIVNYIIVYPDDFADAKIWVPVIAFLTVFQDLVNDGLYALRALFKNKLFAYISVITSIALIAGRIAGAYLFSVGGVVISRVVINAVFGFMLIPLCIRYLPESRLRLSSSEIKEVNVYSFQYMITNGLWALFMLNDLQLLSFFCNDASLIAEYKVAYLLPANISIFATAIGRFTCPYFAKNEKNTGWIRINYRKVFIVTALAVGLAAIIMATLSQWLIVIISGEAYASSATLMRFLLIPAFINSGLRFTTADILSSMGEIKYNLIFSVIGVLLQVILDILLIPSLNVYGVIVANCVAYGFMAIGLFIVFVRKYYRD